MAQWLGFGPFCGLYDMDSCPLTSTSILLWFFIFYLAIFKVPIEGNLSKAFLKVITKMERISYVAKVKKKLTKD